GGDSMNYLVECDGNYGWISFQAGLSPQQSFVYSKDYGWSDLYRSEMCLRIKAHTRTLDSASILGAPTGVKAESRDYNRISLAWNPVANASGYEIFRKAPGKEYERMAAVDYKVASWVDKKAKLGVKYSYRIRAFSVLNGEKYYSGYSPDVSKKAALTAPKTSVKVYSSVSNKVTWTKTSGAQGYMIYRRSSGKKWKLLSSVKASGGRSYVDKTPSPGVTYEYGVRAYRASGKKTYKSACSSSGKWKTSAARQGVKALKNEGKGIRVTWTPQKNCDGYYVYRKEGAGKWRRIAMLPKGTAGSYLDNKVNRGKTYTYYVRALVKNGGKLLQSRYSKSRSIKR
ncbi:MAG: hypothetical protein Q4D55_09070, partial [Eubacteriales bacterium]|nr:hypothetical protein [Eubacteriales bacterium]